MTSSPVRSIRSPPSSRSATTMRASPATTPILGCPAARAQHAGEDAPRVGSEGGADSDLPPPLPDGEGHHRVRPRPEQQHAADHQQGERCHENIAPLQRVRALELWTNVVESD